MKISPVVKDLIKKALKEDCASKDLTTYGLSIKDVKTKAVICAKQDGVLAGLDIAKEVFKTSGRVKFSSKHKDGFHFKNGSEIARIEAKASVILAAERVAVNLLSHLSGIATFTDKFVKVVTNNKIKIYDTRKTLPLMRELEKYAVRVGGGHNHRMNLEESLMIKDNHINIYKKKYKSQDYIIKMMQILKKRYPGKKIILEVHNLSEWIQAMKVKPDVVMFDNWSPEDIDMALQMLNKRNFEIEISGSIRLKQLERILSLGIDRISLGRITHSAPAVDFSLEIV